MYASFTKEAALGHGESHRFCSCSHTYIWLPLPFPVQSLITAGPNQPHQFLHLPAVPKETLQGTWLSSSGAFAKPALAMSSGFYYFGYHQGHLIALWLSLSPGELVGGREQQLAIPQES